MQASKKEAKREKRSLRQEKAARAQLEGAVAQSSAPSRCRPPPMMVTARFHHRLWEDRASKLNADEDL